ncbi:unnamed protein product [Echinostoma caproni]|uniref:Chloride channel protein n=1 Tax=Echinostoma caproni TaxID=27848 RepID=A0A183B0B1_9TREM|nr:unnamed protein product [Echinostoma caproni]
MIRVRLLVFIFLIITSIEWIILRLNGSKRTNSWFGGTKLGGIYESYTDVDLLITQFLFLQPLTMHFHASILVGVFLATYLDKRHIGSHLISFVPGNWMNSSSPTQFSDPGKFALIGAAAQLGGIVRMTLSLTVILMEATGNVIVGLPLLMTLIVAKYTGDYLSEGIYDEHIGLSSMAILPWEPDPLSSTKRAYEVMSSPVVFFDPVMRVGDIVDHVRGNPHHGFPIVEGPTNPARFSYGTLVGLISAEHLGILLRELRVDFANLGRDFANRLERKTLKIISLTGRFLAHSRSHCDAPSHPHIWMWDNFPYHVFHPHTIYMFLCIYSKFI